MTVTDHATTFRSTEEPDERKRQLDQQIGEVLALAESLLGNVTLRPGGGRPGGSWQPVALQRAERALALALECPTDGAPAVPGNMQRTYLSVALTQVRMLRSAVRAERAALGSLSDVRDAFARLRPITSVAELLALAPVQAAELGYQRVLVSRLVSWIWLPCFAYAADGPEMAEGMVRAGSVRPRKLNGTLVEMDMVRDRGAMLVHDAQHHPRTHRELVGFTRTTSYVAAPLVSTDHVVGLLHADRAGGQVDHFDQELLGLFAECLGLALERTVFFERLQALRTQLAAHTNSISDLIGEFVDNETTTLTVPATRPGPSGERPVAPEGELLGLTRRESDILREMATGKTNSQIADRLYISEGTVKSHVKSVLRKLGAANRADAVCRYFQADPRLH